MNCPACYFPILTSVELVPVVEGTRRLGVVCTHCGRAEELTGRVVREPKWAGAELAEKQNRNS